jgi:hypothetical protein
VTFVSRFVKNRNVESNLKINPGINDIVKYLAIARAEEGIRHTERIKFQTDLLSRAKKNWSLKSYFDTMENALL